MKSNNLTYNASLDDAANAISADDRDQARSCIESVIFETGDRADAWLIKAWACDSIQETEIAIQQSLEIDPGNEIAAAGLRWINGIQEWAELQFQAKQDAEEAQRQAEEDARRHAEEARRKAEAEAIRQAEEEVRRQAEEARLKAEAEARQEEAQREAEEASIRAEAEARQAEAEARQAEAEARQAEEEARQAEAEEEARQAEAEEEARQAEAQRQAEIEEERETELDALDESEQARLEAEEQSRRQIEEARRFADEEAQFNAELEKQAELVRNAKAEADEESIHLADLEQHHEEVGDRDEIESEIKSSVDSLADEVRLEIESKHDNAAMPSQPVTKKSLLVLAVDDSPTVRKLVSLTLASDGFEVITANDGVEALNILAERLPDIILSDINMPKLNGYKLCKFVKKHERTKSIPVVMLSGKEGVFDKMRGKMNGCDDYISKPFESAELIKKVRENLAAVKSR